MRVAEIAPRMASVGALLVACSGPPKEASTSDDLTSTPGTVDSEESDADTDADSDTDTDADTDADTDTDVNHDIRGPWTDGAGWVSMEDSTLATVTDLDPWRTWQFVEVDHAAGHGVAINLENTDADGFFSGFHWRRDGDLAWLCHATNTAESQADARDAPVSADDPAVGGCGVDDRGWTRLFPDAWLPIRGSWFAFAGEVHISEDIWVEETATGTRLWGIAEYSLEDRFLVAENGTGTELPGKFSRVDWTETGAGYYVCFTATDRESTSDAAAVPRADDTEPAVGGCEGAPWELLSDDAPLVPVETVGSWVDPDLGITFEISGATVEVTAAGNTQVFHVLSYDNHDGWIAAQNDAGNSVDPLLYSRLDWRDGADTSEMFWCWTASTHTSVAGAEADSSADDTDPTSGGCRGQPWARLERSP